MHQIDTARVYRYLANPGGFGWAIALLCQDGMLAIWSDVGGYVYHWGYGLEKGEDVRKMLLTLNDEYLVEKLAGGRQEFDGEQTRQAIRREILEGRRCRSYSRDFASREWELWRETAFCDEDDARYWYAKTELHDAAGLIQYGPPVRVRAFVVRIWPKIRAAMQQELELERVAGIASQGLLS